MAFPLPLHPGVHIALRRFEFNETDVARAVQEGELASPQLFANSAYFRLRISGTGFAYRPRLKEFVWRDKDIYLEPDFIERCLGLPVVMMHPPGEMLDTDEFAGRIIGMVVRAWIEGEEVWAVARILDLNAAALMVEQQLSTSPGVVFLGGRPVNEKYKMAGGHQLLVEGNPGLLDHVAICPAGVWDKQSGPTGIDIGEGMIAGKLNPGDAGNAEDEAMADNEQQEDKRDDKRSDASNEAILDAINGMRDDVKRIDARVDAMERRHHRDDADDPEQEKRQAAELEKLAAEEEAEAEKAGDKKDKKDGKKDSKHLARRDGESRSGHSRRVDAMAKRHDKKRMARRDAESEDEHSERMDALCRDDDRPDDRRDDRRDDRKDEVEDVGDLHGRGDDRRDDKRDDKRDDRRDAKRDDESEEKKEEEKSEDDRKDDKRDDDKRDDRKDARRDDDRRDDRRDDDKRDDKMRDDARHDSVNPEALARAQRDIDANSRELEQLRRGLDRPADEANQLAEAQARADSVYSLFGDGKRAPAPNVGETVLGYEVRLARGLQAYSDAWKGEDLFGLSRISAGAFRNAATTIYADAAVAARKPLESGGVLRARRRTSETGHQIIEYDGDPNVWMGPFRTPRVGVTRLGLRGQNQ